uniref:palmitoyl-CoA hydrolase n=1 Tax=Neogobius melanostomus TaxID=47308 RepID=A0A8C6UNT4_9GOBI
MITRMVLMICVKRDSGLFLFLLFCDWTSCQRGAAPEHRTIIFYLVGNTQEILVCVYFKAHPGTEVTALDMFDDLFSLRPLWTQVKSFRSALESRLNRTKDGAHLICFSQGGVICRALLSVIQNHNIHSFIALSSPLAGQYGGTDYLKKIFPNTLKRDVYKLCYWKFGQGVSICQYWNDKYLKHSNFLALINGEKDHKDTDVWRKNFLRIKKLVLIGGPDDGVITPWQSRFGSHNTYLLGKQPYYLRITIARAYLIRASSAFVFSEPYFSHSETVSKNLKSIMKLRFRTFSFCSSVL